MFPGLNFHPSTKCENMAKRKRKKFRKQLNDACFPSEMWFLSLLKKNGIDRKYFSRNHSVNRFFIDFAFFKFGIGVEIDGSSHDKTKEYDSKRDSILNEYGWEIIRIKYKDNKKANEVICLLKEKVIRKRTDELIELFI